MNFSKIKLITILIFLILKAIPVSFCINSSFIENKSTDKQDTIRSEQILYNGREWQNPYKMVKGDQFLFSEDFLYGSVNIKGRSFSNIRLKYDLFKDEIIIPNLSGGLIQLNKELVDSFSLNFNGRTYLFVKIADNETNHYVNVLYKGKSALYVWYSKYIKKLAEEGRYDKFYQEMRTYLVRDNIIHNLAGKGDFLRILADNRKAIRDFIKRNNLILTIHDPESFVPVVRYSDTLR